jgi:hypothetical protein
VQKVNVDVHATTETTIQVGVGRLVQGPKGVSIFVIVCAAPKPRRSNELRGCCHFGRVNSPVCP